MKEEPAVTEINDTNFYAEVIKSKLPVLAVFLADWCPRSENLLAAIEESRDHFDGKTKLVKMKLEDGMRKIINPLVYENADVRSFPSVGLFIGGILLDVWHFSEEASKKYQIEELKKLVKRVSAKQD